VKIHLLLFAFLVASAAGRGQQGRQYSFSYYNTTNGSISNQVNSVVQDKEGYIWTATTDGLQRFDGSRYRIFRHRDSDPHSLPSNPVWRVKMDQKNNLWVLMANGEVGIFDTHTFRFRQAKITVDDPKKLYTHKELRIDDEGSIFLVLRGETFLTWNPDKNEFSKDYNFISLTDSMKVVDLAQQPGTKKYWLSTSSGLAIFNRETGRLSYLNFNRENEKAVEAFKELGITGHYFFDSKGRLWFDSWSTGLPAVYAFNSKTSQFDVFRYSFIDIVRSYYEVHGFFEQKDGNVWLYGLGIFAEFMESTKSFQFIYNGYRNGRSIYYDGIQELYEDREENIWVATKNNGLYRFNPSHDFFANVSHINRSTGDIGNGSAMSFIQTNRGTLLAGTWGDGIYHYDKKLNLIPNNIYGISEKQSPALWSMVLANDGNTIWGGAQPGIVKIDQGNRSLEHYQPAALMNKTVRQLVEDREGNLWIGLQNGGLYKWDKKSGSPDFKTGISRFEPIPPSSVNKLDLDSKGRLWVGTANDGLYVIEPSTLRIVYRFHKDGKDAFKTPEPGISSVLEYNDTLTLITTGTEILAFNHATKKPGRSRHMTASPDLWRPWKKTKRVMYGYPPPADFIASISARAFLSGSRGMMESITTISFSLLPMRFRTEDWHSGAAMNLSFSIRSI
jgi:ligand-binding sensor domain-containing protein